MNDQRIIIEWTQKVNELLMNGDWIINERDELNTECNELNTKFITLNAFRDVMLISAIS